DSGQANADSTQFTFVVKPCVKFGPVNGALVPRVSGTCVTAWDMKAGIERNLYHPVKQIGPNGYLADVVAGLAEYQHHPGLRISGIEVPDPGNDGNPSNDRTIIFHLVKPTGDLPFRLGLFPSTPTRGNYPGLPPATGPYYVIPSNLK